jgi:hypothetical protein
MNSTVTWVIVTSFYLIAALTLMFLFTRPRE